MNLRSINHNLLPVLLALLRERSVSRAALAVGLSQPAVSKALAQLRDILKDPLLIRGGRGFVLTRRAEDMLEPVTTICRSLEAIWQFEAFDPAKSHREFVIAGADYCAMLVLPKLLPKLAEVAPHMRIRFVDMVPDMMLDDRTRIDFVIAPSYVIPQPIMSAGCVAFLFTDDFVTIMSSSHPLAAKSRITLKDLKGQRRVAFGHEDPLVPVQASKAGHFLNADGHIMAVVQQFMTLPMLILLTQAVATAPRRLAELAATVLPLKIIENVDEPLTVEMSLAWNERYAADADHRWFKAFFLQHIGENGQARARDG